MNFLDKLHHNDITNTHSFIKNFKGVISSEFCDTLLNEIHKNNDWYMHTWRQQHSSEPIHRDVTEEPSCKFYTNNELEHVIDKCIKEYTAIQEQRYLDIDIAVGWKITEFSQPRWNMYKSGNDMQEHVDHIHSLFEGGNKGVPVYSILGLITDDFTGGEFSICGRRINLSRGDVIIWPSNFMYPHKVQKVTSGTRVTFVSWAW